MASKTKKVSKFANKPFDFTLCITIVALLAIGIIMVLSASSPSALAETGNSYTYVKKQVIFAIIGLFAMMFISKIDYRFYKKFYKIIYIVVLILLALVPLIGYESGGAKRWINLGFTSIQPSEIAKLGLIIFFAAYLTNHKDKLSKLKEGFIYPFLLLAPVILILVLFQKHLSATVIIVLITSIMMIVAGSRISHFATIGLAGGVAGLVGIIVLGAEFRLKRITSFLNPWADAKGTGWQIIQSLYAIGSGGLFGVGLRRK